MVLDIAFNPRLYGYDVGRPSRPRRQVIRVRGHLGGSVMATEADSIMANDATNARGAFSPEEMSLLDASAGLLVVVVGELLPEADLPTKENMKLPGERNDRISKNDFDPAIHTVVPTQPRAFLVVRYLNTMRGSLHVLVNKRDGLCETVSLGHRATDDLQLFIYEEWTDSQAFSRHRLRARRWIDNVAAFKDDFLRTRAEAARPNHLALDESLPLTSAVRGGISRCILSHSRVGDQVSLNKAMKIIRDDLARATLLSLTGDAGVLGKIFSAPETMDTETAAAVVDLIEKTLAASATLNIPGSTTVKVEGVVSLADAIRRTHMLIAPHLHLAVILAFTTRLAERHEERYREDGVVTLERAYRQVTQTLALQARLAAPQNDTAVDVRSFPVNARMSVFTGLIGHWRDSFESLARDISFESLARGISFESEGVRGEESATESDEARLMLVCNEDVDLVTPNEVSEIIARAFCEMAAGRLHQIQKRATQLASSCTELLGRIEEGELKV